MKEKNPRGFDGELFDLFGQLRDRIDSIEHWPVNRTLQPIRDDLVETCVTLLHEIQQKATNKIEELRKDIDDLSDGASP